jgi:dipeptidyl aminopeptidase/acylaminoacyl peptidase
MFAQSDSCRFAKIRVSGLFLSKRSIAATITSAAIRYYLRLMLSRSGVATREPPLAKNLSAGVSCSTGALTMKQHLYVFVMCSAAFSLDSSGDAVAKPTVAPFGSWRSLISAPMLVQGAVRFGDVATDGDTVYWIEGRPEEEGRYVIVRRTADGKVQDVLPKPFSARTLVHEYGGGALAVAGGVVYFTNYADQRLWRLTQGMAPQPITREGKLRFADFVFDAPRNRLIAVCEDHTNSDHEPANRVVAANLADGKITTLVEGADFYSNPRVSPDDRQLCWLAWHHPNMPWDGSELFVAPTADDGSIGKPRKVAGGKDESIFQPSWSPDGTLHFVSDRTNWWNLYAERGGKIVPILPMDAEFGAPQWVFGTTTYCFLPDGTIVARYTQTGEWKIARIDPRTGKHESINVPYSHVSSIDISDNHAFAIVGSPTVPESLVEIDLTSGGSQAIRRSSPMQPDPAYTSVPEAIEFPTANGQTAHAFYYPPANRDFAGPPGEAPPLLVLIHGGPTSAAAAQFRLSTQFWTSRGFGVCDVNYGGSTGYGREYRNRLRGSWGVVDVADAANAALYLAKQGKADRTKLIIRGGSAGGYTTLACLTFSDVFCCGASSYGISDLALMAHDTHKFESRYLDQLVGPYPQDEARYRERSPIFHLDKFNRPVILLQGLEDKIVPPNQAELILDSLKKRGVPVAYIPFPGEQHGFRKAENIIRAHEAELFFYGHILGFEPADKIDPVEIFNPLVKK